MNWRKNARIWDEAEMRHGFIKVAAATPKIKVADTKYNTQVICEKLEEVYGRGAKIIVFPELCITGYTCGDLFLQGKLLQEAKESLLQIARATSGKDALIMVGLTLFTAGILGATPFTGAVHR